MQQGQRGYEKGHPRRIEQRGDLTTAKKPPYASEVAHRLSRGGSPVQGALDGSPQQFGRQGVFDLGADPTQQAQTNCLQQAQRQ